MLSSRTSHEETVSRERWARHGSRKIATRLLQDCGRFGPGGSDAALGWLGLAKGVCGCARVGSVGGLWLSLARVKQIALICDFTLRADFFTVVEDSPHVL